MRPRQIPVLMYHGVSDSPGKDVWTVSTDEFKEQMRQLRDNGFKSVLPRQLTLAWFGFFRLPEKPVVITFDDGYRNNLDIAEPVLAGNGFQAICYLIVGNIAETPEERTQYRGADNLVWAEVDAAVARGTFDFGPHSFSHVPDPVRQGAEVPGVRIKLKHHLGRRPRDYCYPFGQAHERIQAALEKNKFRTAMICEDKVFDWSVDSDMFHIPRVSVYGGTHLFSLTDARLTNGVFTVTASNDGNALPVLGVLRDCKGSRTWNLVPEHRLDSKPQEWRWEGLPADIDCISVAIMEQNGLWIYFGKDFDFK